MQVNIYRSGNTIRSTAEFYDFSDSLADPAIIKFILYDSKYQKVKEFSPVRVGLGSYLVDIQTSIQEGVYVYEWYGEIEGNPTLDRRMFKTKFI